jgi:hypothetical protein
MSENDWDIVLRHTHYLNGYRMVFSNLENGTKQFKRIDKAPYAGKSPQITCRLNLIFRSFHHPSSPDFQL